MSEIEAAVDSAVLDTHVLLDWLVFHNPAVSPIIEAIQRGRLRWIASPALRCEHDLVVGRAEFARWQPDPAKLQSAWQHWALMQADPASLAPWRCTDPDDQKFLDLAWAGKAHWLITRDRALLRLGRRARTQGLEILTPEAWIKNKERVLTSMR